MPPPRRQYSRREDDRRDGRAQPRRAPRGDPGRDRRGRDHLIGFALVGEPLLNFFGISLEALQIAGGLIVAYTGFRMVTAGEELVEQAVGGNVAFSPLAIPLLAGPGAMAGLLGVEGREADQALGIVGTVLGIVLICVVVYACLRSGDLIARRLGPAALSALNVVFGLLVLAIGTELIVHGIVNHGAVVQAGVR